MKEKVICDTGVLSRYLTNKDKNIVNTINEKIGIDNIFITSINRIELLNWLSDFWNLDKTIRSFYKKTILKIPVLHINEPISKIATEISEKYINSKPVDTFICAVALYHNIKIYTIDADFKQIKAPLYKK